MINHLASIYEDPFKVQNARLDYKGLLMKATEKFTDFQTKFLQLAGQARIPLDDLMPDLFDKLTIELQRAVLPTYTSMTTLKELTDQCQAIDQGLRRIKAREEQQKARNPPYKPKRLDDVPSQGFPDYRQPLPSFLDRKQPGKPAEAPPAQATARTLNPIQGITNRCYTCGKEGHYAKECKASTVKPEVALVHDTYKDSGLPTSESEEELEVEGPGKGRP
jgi:hypothetical protein